MRMGKKKQPTYRVVAADSSSPRDGRFIEIVGTYAPRSEPSVVNIDSAKAIAQVPVCGVDNAHEITLPFGCIDELCCAR